MSTCLFISAFITFPKKLLPCDSENQQGRKHVGKIWAAVEPTLEMHVKKPMMQ